MYAAVWHRGRQSLGVARFYQRGGGGPVSQAHAVLFRGAIYLPMLAATLAYTHLEPAQYEEQSYLALNFGAEITWAVGSAAALWVVAYLSWTLWQGCGDPPPGNSRARLHPGELWVVLAHGVAFGSSYALGASNASFLLVLAVYHEVQYLYFTYAMARRSGDIQPARTSAVDPITKNPYANAFCAAGRMRRSEAKFMASFLFWPVIGFAGATIGGWLELKWLAPLGVGGLFCHYWLDGRIWTRRSFQN
jgi:hypothetical protein